MFRANSGSVPWCSLVVVSQDVVSYCRFYISNSGWCHVRLFSFHSPKPCMGFGFSHVRVWDTPFCFMEQFFLPWTTFPTFRPNWSIMMRRIESKVERYYIYSFDFNHVKNYVFSGISNLLKIARRLWQWWEWKVLMHTIKYSSSLYTFGTAMVHYNAARAFGPSLNGVFRGWVVLCLLHWCVTMVIFPFATVFDGLAPLALQLC